MTEKSNVLRANCRRYIDELAAGGTDPMVVGALLRLVNSSAHTAARSTQLWHDNQALRVELNRALGALADLAVEVGLVEEQPAP